MIEVRPLRFGLIDSAGTRNAARNISRATGVAMIGAAALASER